MPYPTITIRLEQMEQEIKHAMVRHLDEMKDALAAELRTAIARYDFGAAVREIAYRVIQAELERAVKDAITHTVWTDDVREALKKTAAAELAKIGVV